MTSTLDIGQSVTLVGQCVMVVVVVKYSVDVT